MRTGTLTTAERLALVTAAKDIIQCDDPEAALFPEDIMASLDHINEERLFAHLMDHAFDTYRKPVVQALFSDIPVITEECERIDESDLTSVGACLNALDVKLANIRPNVKELFDILSAGKNVTVISSYIHPKTRELIYTRKFDVNGSSAQRRAALAYEVNMYAGFPEFIDWEIRLLEGMMEKERQNQKQSQDQKRENL